MNEEVDYYLKKLEATNAAMEALAEKVKDQCADHISEIQKSMEAQSLFLRTI
jgi:hypothetical protein